jgi:hypothetical protein
MAELVERYRHCLEVAQQLPDNHARLALLDMAQAWLVLAEQAAKNAGTASWSAKPPNAKTS